MARLSQNKRRSVDYPHIWSRPTMPGGRQGQRCKKIGKMKAGNTRLVEFKSDGRQYIVQEAGLRHEPADARGRASTG